MKESVFCFVSHIWLHTSKKESILNTETGYSRNKPSKRRLAKALTDSGQDLIQVTLSLSFQVRTYLIFIFCNVFPSPLCRSKVLSTLLVMASSSSCKEVFQEALHTCRLFDMVDKYFTFRPSTVKCQRQCNAESC